MSWFLIDLFCLWLSLCLYFHFLIHCSFWSWVLYIYPSVSSFIYFFTQYFLVPTTFLQRYFFFLVFLWRNMGPCIATGPMLLSLEPETTSWRILAAGDKWSPPLQQLNLPIFTDTSRQRPRLHIFLLIKIRWREDIFSFQRNTPSFPSSKSSSDGSRMLWRSSLLLTSPLWAFHTWLPLTCHLVFPPPQWLFLLRLLWVFLLFLLEVPGISPYLL